MKKYSHTQTTETEMKKNKPTRKYMSFLLHSTDHTHYTAHTTAFLYIIANDTFNKVSSNVSLSRSLSLLSLAFCLTGKCPPQIIFVIFCLILFLPLSFLFPFVLLFNCHVCVHGPWPWLPRVMLHHSMGGLILLTVTAQSQVQITSSLSHPLCSLNLMFLSLSCALFFTEKYCLQGKTRTSLSLSFSVTRCDKVNRYITASVHIRWLVHSGLSQAYICHSQQE